MHFAVTSLSKPNPKYLFLAATQLAPALQERLQIVALVVA